MRIHVFDTQSGEANIDFDKVVAIVRHLPHRENFNVDLHMDSGTIFTLSDCDVPDYMMLLDAWSKGDEEW